MLSCCSGACSLEPKPGVLTGPECSHPLSVAVQCLHLTTSFIVETGGICPVLDQYVFVGFLIWHVFLQISSDQESPEWE